MHSRRFVLGALLGGAIAAPTRPPGAAADLLRFGPWYGEPEDGWTWSRLSAADLPRPRP